MSPLHSGGRGGEWRKDTVMSMLQLESSRVMQTRTIDAAAASRVLTCAARLQAPLLLYRTIDLSPPDVEGVLLVCTDDALQLRMTCLRWDGRGGAAKLHARLIDSPACFHFETRLLDPLPRTTTATLRIRRPETMRIEERRTTHRRTFHHETEVTLWGISDVHHQPCKAALLNLGAGGMACQVKSGDEGRFVVGTTIRVAFIPDADDAIEINLAARIVSTTTAFLPDGVILGLAFAKDSLSHAGLARIQAALTTPGEGGERPI